MNIEDFDLNENEANISIKINSPRTLEAMKILGLDAKDLDPIDYSSVKDFLQKRDRKKDVPKELVDLRFKMLDQRRHDKKKLIVDERNKIMFLDQTHNTSVDSIMSQKRGSTGGQTAQSKEGKFMTIQTQSQNYASGQELNKNIFGAG